MSPWTSASTPTSLRKPVPRIYIACLRRHGGQLGRPLVRPVLAHSYLPFHVPGFGVVIVLAGLTFLGFLAANIAGRTLVSIGEALLDRTPVVRTSIRASNRYSRPCSARAGRSFVGSDWWSFR